MRNLPPPVICRLLCPIGMFYSTTLPKLPSCIIALNFVCVCVCIYIYISWLTPCHSTILSLKQPKPLQIIANFSYFLLSHSSTLQVWLFLPFLNLLCLSFSFYLAPGWAKIITSFSLLRAHWQDFMLQSMTVFHASYSLLHHPSIALYCLYHICYLLAQSNVLFHLYFSKCHYINHWFPQNWFAKTCHIESRLSPCPLLLF